MKIFLISLLKLGLRLIYAPIKLFKTRKRIVYLSRQSNDKSLDMILLEQAIKSELPEYEQVFRLRVLSDGIMEKIKYCIGIIGDMYYLSTSQLAILDTYSITVSCLKHKKSLRVIQMWHALGAIKKFGLQSVGAKEGRDENVSRAMCMHKNYDFILAPSKASAMFYMQAFGCSAEKIKICSLPRVDEILAENGAVSSFYKKNPALSDKKIVLYLPTFREREESAAQQLKAEFDNDKMKNYHLIISAHPLFSKIKPDAGFSYNGRFSSIDLMKVADYIVTDYSACAFEASLLMKPLYFFIPDYTQYILERGANVDIKNEMPASSFENARELCTSIRDGNYDFNSLYKFKSKYVENTDTNNAQMIAKFIAMELGEN